MACAICKKSFENENSIQCCGGCDKIICNSCGTKCENCDKASCDNCCLQCECDRNICLKCVSARCNNCLGDLCSKCELKCEHCTELFCEDCFNKSKNLCNNCSETSI